MKLKWTRTALQQLVEAQDYIAQDNPQAARQIGERIAQAAKLLLTRPEIGRPGRVAGTREWVVQDTPYFLGCKHVADQILVLRVIQGKQNWLTPR